MALKLAITGGTGFVGRHTILAALARGHQVRALARRPQAPLAGVEWISGDLADLDALARLTEAADAVLHIAGVTNARDRAGYAAGNIDGTRALLDVAARLPLVHVSSLAARLPALSRYGWSKRAGEELAMNRAAPTVAVRPPAVYGPGDLQFPRLLNIARGGLLPMPKGAITAMLYGPDLADALLALAEDLAGAAISAGQVLEIDDGAGGYRPADMAANIGAALGRPVRLLEIPSPLLRAAGTLDSMFATVRGGVADLGADRARYMAHPDWSADSGPLLALGLWRPTTPLAEGMAATVAACRAGGLLP